MILKENSPKNNFAWFQLRSVDRIFFPGAQIVDPNLAIAKKTVIPIARTLRGQMSSLKAEKRMRKRSKIQKVAVNLSTVFTL
jgi:hypothetical protein